MLSEDIKNNFVLGAKPSPEDSRDYQVKNLITSAATPIDIKEYRIPVNPPIYDQGTVGCCVSCSFNLLRYIKEYKQSHNKKQFSTSYIFGNRENTDYQGDGMIPREAFKTGQKYGTVLMEEFNGIYDYYTARQLYINRKDELDALAKRFRIDSYYRIYDGEYIKKAVLMMDGVSAMIPVYDSFYTPDANGRVNYIRNQKLYGYHQVCIVGWNENYWLVANSWSDSWGMGGYCWLSKSYPIEEAWAFIDTIDEVKYDMFPDVTKERYDYEAIEKAAEKGIVNGFDDGLFKPDQPLTRGQLCVILKRLGLFE